jgi:aminopeptidase N
MLFVNRQVMIPISSEYLSQPPKILFTGKTVCHLMDTGNKMSITKTTPQLMNVPALSTEQKHSPIGTIHRTRLPFIYFHLYQQAFVKGGHLENLNINNNYKQTFGKYEAAGLGEKITYIRVGSQDLKTESDFSVMKAYLPTPLLPGDSIQFNIAFKTYFDNGTQRRRMKKFNAFSFVHLDGVTLVSTHLCVRQEDGLGHDQHLGKEFYGDFGTYDVELTFASNYIVGATGNLLNKDDVLPDDLRQKLDIRNFAKKSWESPPFGYYSL